jgi:hypothetical protein
MVFRAWLSNGSPRLRLDFQWNRKSSGTVVVGERRRKIHNEEQKCYT